MQADPPLSVHGRFVVATRPQAFTLVEMIAVMAIAVILITLLVPATTQILGGSDLTQTNQLLTNQLALARQQALTQNHPVEVRFYQFADPAAGESVTSPSTWKYRAVQSFVISEAGTATPIGKLSRFPNTIIIDKGATLSTLLGNAQASASTSGAITAPALTSSPQSQSNSIPPAGVSYNSVAFRFYADGSTNLPLATSGSSNLWFLTLHQLQKGDALMQPPANFASIQIDPSNGNLREFRP